MTDFDSFQPFKTELGRVPFSGIEFHFSEAGYRKLLRYLDSSGSPELVLLVDDNIYAVFTPTEIKTISAERHALRFVLSREAYTSRLYKLLLEKIESTFLKVKLQKTNFK